MSRKDLEKLKVIVVGAGLGGLGVAISLLRIGHEVAILEAAQEIAEVGAGIQVLPNSARVLRSWGLEAALSRWATSPKQSNMINWKGELLTSWDFDEASKRYGAPFWDFHRADLHRCLQDRVIELGGIIICQSTVENVICDIEKQQATAILQHGLRYTADLIIGADGINTKLRGVMTGHDVPPKPTGDLAYRLLLDASKVLADPELAEFILNPQVNTWLGPGAHIVNYVLRDEKLFNMVLCMPDDIPENVRVTHGNIDELKEYYKDWDPRILKLIGFSTSADKWKLCIREELEHWYHPSGTFVLLGDAVHATLPYLASGAGITFEDGAVLGECLSRIRSRSNIKHALKVYEKCRKLRTERIVERGNLQQYLAHLPDGEEQRERDRKMQLIPTPPGEAFVWRDPELGPWLLGYDHVKDVDLRWEEVSANL
ncbi:hypothetical protein B7463_g2151, partial [Scytalidium lignicola]